VTDARGHGAGGAAGGDRDDRAGAGHYLVGLDLRDRPVLVVGGGAVARRKVAGLHEAGARVTVVALGCPEMPVGVAVEQRPFREADLDGVVLAVAATDDPALNLRIAGDARRRGVWVNVVDDPQAGSVVLPAVVRRGALRVAVSTGGASPALARRLRERLELELGPEYAALVELLGRLRSEWEPRAASSELSQDRRRAAWHAVLDGPTLDLLRAGRSAEAEAAARCILAEHLTASS